MNTRTTSLLATLAALLMLVSACGTDDEPIDAGAPAGDEPADSGDDGTGDEPAEPADSAGDGSDETLPPLGAGPYPVGTLEITVTHPDADPVSYIVSCLGDTATITPAVAGLSDQAACQRLGDPAAQTLLVDGPDPDRVCTEIYGGPDEAAIIGTLDDKPVDTVITRENGCGIDDWDTVLAGVLPKAIGAR